MIDLIEKLKDCPKETVLYSPFFDEVKFIGIEGCKIKVSHIGIPYTFNRYGQYINMGECMLFPSKDNRDWEKFNVSHSFMAFDKVVCRNKDDIYILNGVLICFLIMMLLVKMVNFLMYA